MNQKQQQAFDEIFINKNNVFVTGLGGTGKTFLIKNIIQKCNKSGISYGATSMTGISAQLFGGTTLHSFTGIGKGEDSVDKLLTSIEKNRNALKRWIHTRILIIDEISMMSQMLFEKLNEIGQRIRNQKKLFGGIQLIVCGDFLQLPPVKNPHFCFESDAWNFKTIELTENMRQSDPFFQKILSEIRMGIVTEKCKETLNTCVNKENPNIEIVPTQLFSNRKSVDTLNEKKLKELKQPIKIFVCEDSIDQCASTRQKEVLLDIFDKNCMFRKHLKLCVNAQVMLVKNLSPPDLVNGSRGYITKFNENGLPVVKFTNDLEISIEYDISDTKYDKISVKRKQLPLILAWALTIHKCISGDTLVSDTRGMRKIKSYTNVPGWSNCEIELNTFAGIEKSSKIYKGEVEPSIKIITKLGYSLEGSHRHPIMIRNEWVKLPDIKPGMNVVMQCGSKCGSPLKVCFNLFQPLDNLFQPLDNLFQPLDNLFQPLDNGCKIPEIINEDLSYLFGMLVTIDINEFRIEFCNDNYELVKRFENIIKDYFDVECFGIFDKTCFFNNTVKKFLHKCGLGQKQIPWTILQNTIECQQSFIKGLFDTNIDIPNTLIDQVHVMLLNIGIITDKKNLKESVDIIIPNGQSFIKSIKDEIYDFYGYYKLKKTKVGNLIDNIINNTTKFRHSHIQYLVNKIKYLDKMGEKSKELLHMNSTGIFYDVVERIEYGECMMYDFEVPGSHTFISNGFVSHNCQGSTLDCVQVNLSNVFEDGQFYTALSRVKDIESLYISNIDYTKVYTNQKAIDFYKSIL